MTWFSLEGGRYEIVVHPDGPETEPKWYRDNSLNRSRQSVGAFTDAAGRVWTVKQSAARDWKLYVDPAFMSLEADTESRALTMHYERAVAFITDFLTRHGYRLIPNRGLETRFEPVVSHASLQAIAASLTAAQMNAGELDRAAISQGVA